MSIEDIQYRHIRALQGHARDEVCGHCGLAWPCDVAEVFAAWDRDSVRQIVTTKALYRDVASRLVRGLTSDTPIKGKPTTRLKRKAEFPESSYDPLVRESAVLGILAAIALEEPTDD